MKVTVLPTMVRVHMYVRTCVCVYVYVRTYVRMYTICLCTSVCVCVRARVRVGGCCVYFPLLSLQAVCLLLVPSTPFGCVTGLE